MAPKRPQIYESTSAFLSKEPPSEINYSLDALLTAPPQRTHLMAMAAAAAGKSST